MASDYKLSAKCFIEKLEAWGIPIRLSETYEYVRYTKNGVQGERKQNFIVVYSPTGNHWCKNWREVLLVVKAILDGTKAWVTKED